MSSWINNIDDIKIVHKRDGRTMEGESTLNFSNKIFVCPCGVHVNIEVKGK